MAAYCPTCRREFEVSGGYCPHDGATLKAGRPKAKPDDTDEDNAMALLQSQGIGLEELEDDYDRFLGIELDNRYKITRKLGEGGMGVVFYAEHVVIQKPVAIKILKKSVSRDPSTVQRFIQEARAASRIGHPNIVDVTDFGETPDGLAYQVMEFLDGPTLADLIHTRKQVEIKEAVPIVAQVARALDAAHQKGIIHRDLKPENIFLIERHGRSDFVKIVDFGIAKVNPQDESGKSDGPRLTRAGAVFGTPEYMAPEQASGSGDTDHRADIYSLGAIFFEMLVGRVPLSGENTVRTLAMVILEEAPNPRDVVPTLELPPKIEAVLMKALAKKRDDRFATMGELADRLEKAYGKRLAPRIGPGIGSLPPLPPSSGELRLPQPDTVPDVGPPDMSIGEMSSPNLAPMISEGAPDEKPTDVFEPEGKGRGKGKRRKRPSTRDPLFVETAQPGYDSIEEPDVDDYLRSLHASRSRAPVVIAILILLAGAGAAGYLVATRGDKREASTLADAGAQTGGVTAAATVDASVVAEAAIDAGPASPPDAAPAKTAAGSKRGKKPDSMRITAHRFSDVRVMTRPADGRVFVGGIPRGPDGVTLRESIGARLSITCKLDGYKDGRVSLRVTKSSHLISCDMEKKPRCVDGLQNPFGDCP